MAKVDFWTVFGTEPKGKDAGPGHAAKALQASRAAGEFQWREGGKALQASKVAGEFQWMEGGKGCKRQGLQECFKRWKASNA